MRSLVAQATSFCCTNPRGYDDLVIGDANLNANQRRQHIAVDCESRSLFVTVDSNSAIVRVLYHSATAPTVETLQLPALSIDSSSSITSLQHIPELDALCMAYTGGDIVLLPLANYDPAIIDDNVIVGSVESGILAMEWSPDKEVVAIITGKRTVLVMTKDFDMLSEVNIQTSEFGKDQFVNVGWGKKETQFHGSVGKSAAHARGADEDPLARQLSPDDDAGPRLSWRGDGAFFCCSTVDDTEFGVKRSIRVYSREGVLHSTSEVVPQLEHPLSWRPSGNLIASSQRLPHRHDVVFFERNGLRHGEFTLREPTSSKVIDMLWNQDSTILAIWILRENRESVVQLWSSGNYYWYLKYEIKPLNDDIVTSVMWDPEESLRIYVGYRSGNIMSTDFILETITTSSLSTETPASVAVIDGNSLLLTPFRLSNIPPPMSSTKLSNFPSSIISAAFGPGSNGDDVAVMLSDGTIVAHCSKGGLEPPMEVCRFSIVGEEDRFVYRQLVWPSQNTMLWIASSSESLPDHLLLFDFATTGVPKRSKITIPGIAGILRVVSNVAAELVLIEAIDGRVWKLCLASRTPEYFAKLPESCPWISATFIGKSKDELAVIGLSSRNRLYINSRELAHEVTSFAVHENFLVYTTLSHTARFIRLDHSFDQISAPSANDYPYDETSRRVERGSKIVVVIPGDTRLVLQMPRGNLETVHPRALVLSVIRGGLERLRYDDVFMLCRKHRIDMNLIVDHNPSLFAENIVKFIDLVRDADYLNLFISSLRDDDVTITMYQDGLKRVKFFNDVRGTKVNFICKLIQEELLKRDKTTYITTILTTDAKKSPPELETAMMRIKEMKSDDADDAESALKYLIFIANVDRLYDVALGMYDFALVILVAQFSQKDPREYIPFLTELRQLPKFRQRFRIDSHLGRNENAIYDLCELLHESDSSNPSESPAIFQEIVQFCERHRLYKPALDVLRINDKRRLVILCIYGEHLKSIAAYEDAGLVFYMAGEAAKAIEAYTLGLCWNDALSLAEEMKMPEVQKIDLATSLSESHKYYDAAILLIDYTSHISEGVKLLLKGSYYSEALRIVRKIGRSDLINTVIKPEILEAYEHAREEITEMLETFTKQRQRLSEVREENDRKREAAEAGLYDPLLDSIDMMSDTTSMATSRNTGQTGGASRITGITSRTKLTFTSSRAKRKQERKRAGGQKGGIYEEEFLVTALNSTVQKSNELRPSIFKLVKVLSMHLFMQQARDLQTLFLSLINALRKGMMGVFEGIHQESGTVEQEKIKIMMAAGALEAAENPSAPIGAPAGAQTADKWLPKFPVPTKFADDVQFGFAVVD